MNPFDEDSSSEEESGAGTMGGERRRAGAPGSAPQGALGSLLAEIQAEKKDGGVKGGVGGGKAGSGVPVNPINNNVLMDRIPPDMDEMELSSLGAMYGDVHSVKVMWPFTDAERERGWNVGFIAFVSPEAAETAREALNGRVVRGKRIRTTWGKPVGNNTTVMVPQKPPAVPPPDDEGLKVAVDAWAWEVCRSGPGALEGVRWTPGNEWMNDPSSSSYKYYGWRLWMSRYDPRGLEAAETELQRQRAEEAERAKAEERRVKGIRAGSHLRRLEEDEEIALVKLLREMTVERASVGKVTVWVMDRAAAARDIVEVIGESLLVDETPVPKKLARLYLVSDVLANSAAPVSGAYEFREAFSWTLPAVFSQGLFRAKAKAAAMGEFTSRKFEEHVHRVINAWRKSSLYPDKDLERLLKGFETGEDMDGVVIGDEILAPSRFEAKLRELLGFGLPTPL